MRYTQSYSKGSSTTIFHAIENILEEQERVSPIKPKIFETELIKKEIHSSTKELTFYTPQQSEVFDVVRLIAYLGSFSHNYLKQIFNTTEKNIAPNDSKYDKDDNSLNLKQSVEQFIEKNPRCLTSQIIDHFDEDPLLIMEILKELEHEKSVQSKPVESKP